jgi:hypothetical protein
MRRRYSPTGHQRQTAELKRKQEDIYSKRYTNRWFTTLTGVEVIGTVRGSFKTPSTRSSIYNKSLSSFDDELFLDSWVTSVFRISNVSA